MLASDVLVVNVDTVGGQAGQRGVGALLLVVEDVVEAELLAVLDLVVGANAADDGQALALGQLADDLADGAGGAADEDGLALLGLANLKERRVGGQARHAEDAQVVGQLELARLLHLEDALLLRLLGRQHHVLLVGAQRVLEHVALGEPLALGLQHAQQRRVLERLPYRHGRKVRLDLGLSEAPALVGVERGVENLCDHATLGGHQLERPVLDHEVLAGLGEALGSLLEDDGLVASGCHFVGCVYVSIGVWVSKSEKSERKKQYCDFICLAEKTS